MMISVVIAPTIVGEAASEPTRPRPVIASPLYMWGSPWSLAEEEVEEVAGRGARGRGAAADAGKAAEALREGRQLLERRDAEDVVELLLGLALEVLGVDTLEELLDLILLLLELLPLFLLGLDRGDRRLNGGVEVNRRVADLGHGAAVGADGAVGG